MTGDIDEQLFDNKIDSKSTDLKQIKTQNPHTYIGVIMSPIHTTLYSDSCSKFVLIIKRLQNSLNFWIIKLHL